MDNQLPIGSEYGTHNYLTTAHLPSETIDLTISDSGAHTHVATTNTTGGHDHYLVNGDENSTSEFFSSNQDKHICRSGLRMRSYELTCNDTNPNRAKSNISGSHSHTVSVQSSTHTHDASLALNDGLQVPFEVYPATFNVNYFISFGT